MGDNYEDIKIDKSELEKAKSSGKKIIYKMKIREQIEKIKEKFDEGEEVEVYFGGQNAITASRKTLQVAIIPMMGLCYNNWKTDLMLVFTNRKIYIMNLSSNLTLIDCEIVKRSDIIKYTYFKGKKLKTIEIKATKKREFAIYIDDIVEELYIEELKEKYDLIILNNEYTNWRKKATKILVIFYPIFTLLLFILFYWYFKNFG